MAGACSVFSLFVGLSEVRWSPAPRGDCVYCCPIRAGVDVRYLLYTRTQPTVAQTLSPLDPAPAADALARSGFDLRARTLVYLAGFSERVPGPSALAVRDAFLARADYNVVLVDWSNLVLFPWYISAVRNTRYMGARLAEFVLWLGNGGAAPDTLHVVGFSLGAEAAGFAGKRLRRAGVQLARITGLDPAYPGYRLADARGHLARGDAAFVDVLHTNPGVLGFPQPIGDVDFYPNGHGWPVQPGCLPHELLAERRLGQLYGCSHNRAWRLFVESVATPSGFPATRCRRWSGPLRPCNFTVDGYMGLAAAPPMSGKLYLVTNPTPPYARNGP